MRLGTYIDTLELENEALREKTKALAYQVKMLEYELKKKESEEEFIKNFKIAVSETHPDTFY